MEAANPLWRKYRIGKELGRGSFARVNIAQHVRTRHNVAVKIINRRQPIETVRREIDLFRLCAHPHVVRMYEVIATPTQTHVIMEHMKQGELFNYILEKGRLPEDEARDYFQQIIAGVEHCHKNNVVHRDLKPENLLLDGKGNVKIADFGLSETMEDGRRLSEVCGSKNYMAPEIFTGKGYGHEVDIWSCGAILYALLCGSFAFDGRSDSALLNKIKTATYALPDDLSGGARDLIQKILVVDPTRRITIPSIRQHHWFKQNLPPYLPLDVPQHLNMLDGDIIKEVVGYGFKRGHLILSLLSSIQTDATVAYYLLLHNRPSNTVASSCS
ncbi:SNF1-related protein kinase catalytic subunit alpha KIN10-like [Salvia divinorum]|uniref:SNF1-related protein kinase catalytic subunit alpha KIN10-like n=1 Tax=Salvia divinorum TaxID=28513 RepID=A0ABD1G4X7_SALDI